MTEMTLTTEAAFNWITVCAGADVIYGRGGDAVDVYLYSRGYSNGDHYEI